MASLSLACNSNVKNPPAGTVYYRLAQSDWDDAVSYSGVRTLSFATTGEVKLFPNPAYQAEVTVSHPGTLSTGRITVYDVQGRRVYETDLHPNDTSTRLLTDGWDTGVYLVELRRAGAIERKRLIKM